MRFASRDRRSQPNHPCFEGGLLNLTRCSRSKGFREVDRVDRVEIAIKVARNTGFQLLVIL